MTLPAAELEAFLGPLRRAFGLLAVRAHPPLPGGGDVPCAPALARGARLDEAAGPHVAAFLKTAGGHVVLVERTWPSTDLVVDAAELCEETPAAVHAEVAAQLVTLFPGARVALRRPTLLGAEPRIGRAVAAYVITLQVLESADFPSIRDRLDRLRLVGDLMEKESRVSSWGVRTVTPLVLAAAGAAVSFALERFGDAVPRAVIDVLGRGLPAVVGLWLLAIGLRAVRLTRVGTGVWRRSTELRLLLDARVKLADASKPSHS